MFTINWTDLLSSLSFFLSKIPTLYKRKQKIKRAYIPPNSWSMDRDWKSYLGVAENKDAYYSSMRDLKILFHSVHAFTWMCIGLQLLRRMYIKRHKITKYRAIIRVKHIRTSSAIIFNRLDLILFESIDKNVCAVRKRSCHIDCVSANCIDNWRSALTHRSPLTISQRMRRKALENYPS